MRLNVLRPISVLVFTISCTHAHAQEFRFKDCAARLSHDTLTISNGAFVAQYTWNQGNVKLFYIGEKRNADAAGKNATEDLFLPGEGQGGTPQFTAAEVKRSPTEQSFLQIEINFMLGAVSIRRIFEISPGTPALRTYYYLKGTSVHSWGRSVRQQTDLIEDPALLARQTTEIARLGSIPITGNHWKINAVEFTDVTDQNNTLVNKKNYVLYRRPISIRGNLLFATDATRNFSFFVLKESPAPASQLSYPGFDFVVSDQRISIVGMGLSNNDINENQWTRSYAYVLGIAHADTLSQLTALRLYQKSTRALIANRDDMVLMNTWGDRGQDSRMSEAFVLKELDHAHHLGITHLQLDDGWQAGISKNSSTKAGQLWDSWKESDWQPHPGRFPNGFKPVIEKAKALGIEIGLWFNPGSDNHYATWERDAKILTNYYTQWGIRTFKIDGVNLPDKTSEENLRKLVEKVTADTKGVVVFNFDVTAGTRPGYHYFNEYGNIFLENRYTDWGNYYPYWTLRNLWMLSSYVPPERLQIEFLNKWRNADKYPKDDYLAPVNLPLDYLIAITLMAQPLAWLEGGNLPDDAYKSQAVLATYKKIQHDIHEGTILPIGNEPNGNTWTGFQSMNGAQGYFLVFREHHDADKEAIKTWLPTGKKIELTSIVGQGKSFASVVDEEGKLTFQLPTPNSFALYRYQIK